MSEILHKILNQVNPTEQTKNILNPKKNFLITENTQNTSKETPNANKSLKYSFNSEKKIINRKKNNSPLKELLTTNIFIYQSKYKNKAKNLLNLKKFTINTEEDSRNQKQRYCIPVMLNINNKEKIFKKKLYMIPYNNNNNINLKNTSHSLNLPKINNKNKNNINKSVNKSINNNDDNKIKMSNSSVDFLEKVELRRKILKEQIMNRYTIMHGNHYYKNYFKSEKNKKEKNFWEDPVELNNNNIIDDTVKDKIIGYEKIFFKFKDGGVGEINKDDNNSKINSKRNLFNRNKDKNLNFYNMKFSKNNYSSK